MDLWHALAVEVLGPDAQRGAWEWLAASRGGSSIVVASDAHDAEDRPPRMSAAIESISAHLGHVVASRICIENPLKLLGDLPARSDPTQALSVNSEQ